MITMHFRPRETDRQTDGRTDRWTMAIARRFVLANASRVKKWWCTSGFLCITVEHTTVLPMGLLLLMKRRPTKIHRIWWVEMHQLNLWLKKLKCKTGIFCRIVKCGWSIQSNCEQLTKTAIETIALICRNQVDNWSAFNRFVYIIRPRWLKWRCADRQSQFAYVQSNVLLTMSCHMSWWRFVQFANPCNLQNVLRNLARVMVQVRVRVAVTVMVGVIRVREKSSLGQKFANGACAISRLRS